MKGGESMRCLINSHVARLYVVRAASKSRIDVHLAGVNMLIDFPCYDSVYRKKLRVLKRFDVI